MGLFLSALDIHGRQHTLPPPLTFRLTKEYAVPADGLALTFASPLPRSLCEIKAVWNGTCLLDGVVDEQSLLLSAKGTQSTLYARSRAALLLDSEAKPATLQNPGTGDVFSFTAQPLGFSHRLPQTVLRGQYLIPPGTCLWSALADFMMKTAEAQMTLSGRALSLFHLNRDTEHRLSGAGGALPYLSIETNERRCTRVGTLHYKTSPEEDYPWQMKNEAAGGGAVRYRNLSPLPPWQWAASLRSTLRQGEGAAEAVTALLPGHICAALGDTVHLPAAFTQPQPLYLAASELYLGKKGWQTRWELRPAAYFSEEETICG